MGATRRAPPAYSILTSPGGELGCASCGDNSVHLCSACTTCQINALQKFSSSGHHTASPSVCSKPLEAPNFRDTLQSTSEFQAFADPLQSTSSSIADTQSLARDFLSENPSPSFPA